MDYSEIQKSAVIGELRAMQVFVALGFEVYQQLTGKEAVDFIAVKNNNIYRVEVKTTSVNENDSWVFQIGKTRHNATNKSKKCRFNEYKKDLDLLVLYVKPKDCVLVYHKDEIHTQTQVRIHNKEMEVRKYDEFLKYEATNTDIKEK